MGKKVICYIQAYDCKKTIEAAMESVLNQTYDNWICFVLSNGNSPSPASDNGSFDVIKAVAARDSRFVVLNKKYNRLSLYFPMLCLLGQKFPDSYICSLDADDTYKSDFFERGVALAETHGLDIVACGTEIVLLKMPGAKKETLLRRREISEDLIVRGEDFTRKFPVYKPFFNEMWGKLYDASIFGKEHNTEYSEKHFAQRFLPDTLITLDQLSRSSAIGVLSGTSHKFYQFEQRSMENATAAVNGFDANSKKARRLFGDSWFSVYDTYEAVFSFLRSRGEIDDGLYEYMQAVLFGWFQDFYSRTLLLTTSEKNLAQHVSRLVFHPKFDELMRYRGSGRYHNLKNYEQRIEFCRLLRNTLICQEGMGNRERGKKIHLPCTKATKRNLDRIVAKLDKTLQVLSDKQKKED